MIMKRIIIVILTIVSSLCLMAESDSFTVAVAVAVKALAFAGFYAAYRLAHSDGKLLAMLERIERLSEE